MDEREAIARLKAGDIGGLETLVRVYQVRAVRAAWLVVGDTATAEDIVQEAFLRATERIGQFDVGRPFGPWFLRSVVNDAVKMVTRQRQVPWADDTGEEGLWQGVLAVDPQPGPAELLEHLALSESVGRALETLSPPRRAAVVLRYYLELSEPEIAKRLRWPLGTVKRRLHDARRCLRALLAGDQARQEGGETTKEARAGVGLAPTEMKTTAKP
ncbi:MAG: RNA polymerase sigma factor [Anaerolineae bacterium]